MTEVRGNGDFEFRTRTSSGLYTIYWGGGVWDDSTRRVFHVVYDSNEGVGSDRIRLYMNGVDQGAGTSASGTWPDLGATLNLGSAPEITSMNRQSDFARGLNGTVYYYAVYDGEMTDGEISTNATALSADDDNITPSVTVTPDGAAVTKEAGTEYSQEFTIANGAGVTDDFDLLAWTGPAVSFITVDSITFNGLSFTSPSDSARLVGLAAATSDTATVWYTVASSTPGRVDTLFMLARSITETTVADTGSVEVEFSAPPAALLGRYWFNEAPSGQVPTTAVDDQASPVNLGITYDTPVNWTVSNGHRGLGAPTATHSGLATADATGTKYDTNLDGATQASFVAVAEWGTSSFGQVLGGFIDAGVQVVNIETRDSGDLIVRVRTNLGSYGIYWGGGAWADSTRRVFHAVLDFNEPVQEDRIRLYMNGVDQGTGTAVAGWPTAGETLDFGSAPSISALNRPSDSARGLNGTVYYYAVYDGELTDSEISTNATALSTDDDNLTYAVTVTPDGATVVRQIGTEFSFDFTLNNGSTVIEDFDLLGSTDPVSSFITIDSITGGGIATSGVADSARIVGVDAGADSTVTVWYSIASDTDGNIDTLYLQGRSISDNSVTDLGSLEIEFEAVTLTVTPDGVDTLQILPTGLNGSSSYKFTITNSSQVSETFDLLASAGAMLTVDSITGPNVSGGVPGDSARTGTIAAAADDSAFVWFSVEVGTPAQLDSLYLMGRSVSQPTATDSGWVFVEQLRPAITITHGVAPPGAQLPGTDMTYTVTITNNGNYDASNVVTIDSLGVEMEFKVGSVVDNMPMTVTVAYSNDNKSSWTYTPVSGGCGATTNYDDCVTHIRFTLDSDLSYVGPNNTGNVEYVARIK
jgi:uncharacterized repeat protein (TIGR01451 family)